MYCSAETSSNIIVGGVHHPVHAASVLTWHNTGIAFAVGDGHNRPRRQRIDLVVWHWTGGEGDPPAVARVLRARGYGVEFAIARDGTIYQFCDPLDVDTADAAGVNARSVGVEIVSYGLHSTKPGWSPPKAGRDRTVTPTRIHGALCHVAGFYPAQLAAAHALGCALSTALELPRVVPPAAMSTVLSNETLERFRGHVGHYHVSRQKTDPGPAFMTGLGLALAGVGTAGSGSDPVV